MTEAFLTDLLLWSFLLPHLERIYSHFCRMHYSLSPKVMPLEIQDLSPFVFSKKQK
jgi:hypothetical protein